MNFPQQVSALLKSLRLFQERRRRLMGLNLRNRALITRANPRKHRHLADDKLVTKAMLDAALVPTVQTITSFRGLGEVPAALDVLKRHETFVLKPTRGSGGRGIIVVVGRDGDDFVQAGGQILSPAALRKHMAEIVFGAFSKTLEDSGLVEHRINAHPLLRELGPVGLSDIRVLVLDGQPFAAMLRVPTRKSSGKANLHAGGLGLGLDLKSGQITRAVQSGKAIHVHPDTGADLTDVRLPHWDLVLDVARRAAAVFPLRYLGIDICLDEARGPLVLEVNVRPGLEIQNICGVSLIDALESP